MEHGPDGVVSGARTPAGSGAADLVIFDLDGTLIDSDAALVDAFIRLGVDRSTITFGHVIADECRRLGISLDAYLDTYDPGAAQPFPGVPEMLDGIGPWAICSNKHPRSGHAELDRLGWTPQSAFFADSFSGQKDLHVVLDVLEIPASSVLYVGDTDHDRDAARAVGCRFVLAGWNPRVRARSTDEVADAPSRVLDARSGQALGSSVVGDDDSSTGSAAST